MDETPPILNRSTNQSSLFEGINKYLVMVLVIFTLIVIVLVGYIVFIKKTPLTLNTAPSLLTDKKPSQNTSSPDSVVSPAPAEPLPLFEARFAGQITKIDRINKDLTIYTLQSVIDSPDKTGIFPFTKDQLSRTGVDANANALSVGDRINSIQWVNPTLAENDGLVGFVFDKPQTINTPYNQFAYELIKRQKTTAMPNFLERIYSGKIQTMDIDTDTVSLTLERQMYDKVSAVDKFVFSEKGIDKTIGKTPETKGLTVYKQLSVGDTIDIIEDNDYSKDYQNSIINIIIEKK